MVHLILLLRGHERNTFNNNKLNNFVNKIKNKFVYSQFFIHTWNLNETSSSWRHINTAPSLIKINNIQDYFDNDFKSIIDDENNVQIKGNKNTKIGSMPIIGWKRMWYGQKKHLILLKKILIKLFLILLIL